MQQLKQRHGKETVERALRFVAIRLQSQPNTAQLAAGMNEHRARINKLEDAYEQAREERVASSAVIKFLDQTVDNMISAIGREMVVMTSNNPDDPRYQTLFPMAPSKATKGTATETQNRFVNNVIETLARDDRFSSLRKHLEPLKAAQKELESTLGKREELYMPEVRTQTELRVALDQARRDYNKLGAQLMLMYPGRDALVDSFFLKMHRAADDDDETADESTTPTTATTTSPVMAID